MISRPWPALLSAAVTVTFLALVTGTASQYVAAQCATQWLAGLGVPGTGGGVRATTMWDPDGAGPLQPVLAVAGDFTIAGTVLANRIAAYDPVTGAWSALGSGFSAPATGPVPWVAALAALPNGDLVAAGLFTAAGGVPANNIARWNGTSWSALGSGLGSGMFENVTALTTLPNGDVVAAGDFMTAGGTSANRVARWNGTSWSALGPGMNSTVLALTMQPNGGLVAGGYFTTAGGVSAYRIARWDGTSWSALGSGMNSSVDAITTLPNGDLVAGGQFTTAGGMSANRIARWDGTSWSALGSGIGNGWVDVLATLPNGHLVAAGSFTTAGGVSASNIAGWNGTSWSALGSATNGAVYALTTMPNGDLVAGGWFATAGSVSANNVARWSGTSWSALGSGNTNGAVYALTTMPNGDLVVGGFFTTAGSVSANNIARWDGTSWSALGSGMTGSSGPFVSAVAVLPNGDLVAGGRFTAAGGISANSLARWNGTSWSAVGSGGGGGSSDYVTALATLPNGDLVVAGSWYTTVGGGSLTHVYRWNGTSWSALGSGMFGPFVNVGVLAVRPNGDLVAGGWFTLAGSVNANNIARWDGTSWSALGSGMNGGVGDLTTLPNGDLVAGGQFTTAGGMSANRVARWDGTGWSALGSGMNASVDALTTLPNGDLVAGGQFTTAGGMSASRIARWNGTSWSGLGSGTNDGVRALATLSNGDLVAGGDFTFVHGAISAYMAQLTTTCPATVVAYGAGCTGSGGPNVLAATSLPWTGSTFRSLATGMPALALAVGVLGFGTTSIPMPSILPQGVPGCTLLVSADLLDLYVPAAGSVQTQVAIPNAPALAGAVLHQQVVSIELGGSGSITALTGTNALTLTVGTF